MKDGTKYAARLRGVFSKLRKSAPKSPPAEADDPLRRLAVAIFAENGDEESAARALDRVFKTIVDWNELRVSTPQEVALAAGLSGADAPVRAKRLLDALRAIYMRENKVSLAFLAEMPRREGRQYLEKLDGLGHFAAASVVLWSFGGHAIPVDDKLVAALRASELIHPEATLEEVQAFLERNVSAADAKEFALVIRHLVTHGPIERAGRRAPKAAGDGKAARSKSKATSKSPAARKDKAGARKGAGEK